MIVQCFGVALLGDRNYGGELPQLRDDISSHRGLNKALEDTSKWSMQCMRIRLLTLSTPSTLLVLVLLDSLSLKHGYVLRSLARDAGLLPAMCIGLVPLFFTDPAMLHGGFCK